VSVLACADESALESSSHTVRGASDDAICRPAWLYSLIQKQASRTVPGWLRPVSPVPSDGLCITLSLFYRVVTCSIFTSALHCPLRLTPRQAPQHLRLGVVPVLPSTPLPGFTGQNFITTTASSATSPPSLPWLAPWALTLFHEYGVRLPRLLHRLPAR